MQKYRLYPAFFTQEFPVLYSGNGQERHQQIPVQLTAPIALPNTQTRFTVVFVHSLKGDFAACMAIIQESLQIKMLEEGLASFTCADCVFLLLPCGTTHTPCTCILSADDPREKNSVCAVGHSLNQRNTVLTTVYIAHLGLVYRDYLQLLLQALAFI